MGIVFFVCGVTAMILLGLFVVKSILEPKEQTFTSSEPVASQLEVRQLLCATLENQRELDRMSILLPQDDGRSPDLFYALLSDVYKDRAGVKTPILFTNNPGAKLQQKKTAPVFVFRRQLPKQANVFIESVGKRVSVEIVGWCPAGLSVKGRYNGKDYNLSPEIVPGIL